MIDFTTIEVNPLPLPIQELQKANIDLAQHNKVLNRVVLGLIGLGIALLIYNAVKKNNHEEK